MTIASHAPQQNNPQTNISRFVLQLQLSLNQGAQKRVGETKADTSAVHLLG